MSTIAERPIDQVRRVASEQLNPERRAALGQFMTPTPIADFMASLFDNWPDQIRLLDPGAGIGSLTEAFFSRWLDRRSQISEIAVTAYEIDPSLLALLKLHVGELETRATQLGRVARSTIADRDFVREAAFSLSFQGPRFTHAILNPPYKKINTDSEYRRLLSGLGIETVNLYAVFLALAVALCEKGGEIVAIVPRSFCNGTYFRPFRKWLMERVAIKQLHVFESRTRAFSDDGVLQENIIIHLVRDAAQGPVLISSSNDATFADYSERSAPFAEIIKPSDKELFIHIPTTTAAAQPDLFAYSLAELGLEVATGPVVDFRVREHWLDKPTDTSAPLLYAHHFGRGEFRWPRDHRKPNALTVNDETRKWLMPRGWYTLTKRFSSKEERRRIVAYTVGPKLLANDYYGFENHLNVIHSQKRGLSEELACGVALFLNSTVVDQHFRTFSGHTQVNATDLRSMRFPSRETLERFGKWAKKQTALSQAQIDEFVASNHAN